ncbi:uncharacterized protein LOC141613900 [Silene latifolia]|uniref:uncharacterized protein LOC141613900 n=1 Tax=Silene latifolia TaxID=37657 RepID=UPI003D77E208
MQPMGLGNLELSDDEKEIDKTETRELKKSEKTKQSMVPRLILREILSKKRSFDEVETVAFTHECYAALQANSPPKLKDPGSFSIACNIGPLSIDNALCDLGASVSVMPYKICNQLNMTKLKCTNMTIQLAEKSIKHPMGILEDVPVKIRKFFIPVDFVVIDIAENSRVPIILG